MPERSAPSETISLVVADVDGTLVTEDKVLTPRARAAVAALNQAGVAFAVTSGRPPRGMTMLVEPLALSEPIAGFNGGVFVTPSLEPIETHTLPTEVARQTLAMLGEHGFDAWVYTATDWLVRDRGAPHVAREEWTVKFAPKVVPDFAGALDGVTKIVGVSDDHDRLARCEAALQAALGGRASAARSQPYYLDVTHPSANKGVVVSTLSRMLGVPAAEIATIGDMPNDVLMFRASGLSIAMGNASDAVKSQAHLVTDSYNDEGFAKAMERFVLPRARQARAAAS